MYTWGSPGTWETLSSPPRDADGGAAHFHQALQGCAWSCKGANKQAISGIRGPKETKPEETGGRESERSIVPVIWGNLPQGTPRRKGSAIAWNFWRERWKEYQVLKLSQRNCKR